MSQVIFLGSGGAGGGIITLDGNTGSATGSVVTVETSSEATLLFSGTGSTLTLNTTGPTDNVAYGEGALFNGSLTLGGGNVGIGYFAGFNITTGSSNLFLGTESGRNLTTGTNNIILSDDGSGQRYTSSESYNILIANLGIAGETGSIRIGSAGNQSKCFIAGIRGVTTANNNAIPVLVDSLGQLGTVSSSIRHKDNVEDMGQYSSLLMRLRPVTFNYNNHLPTDISVGLIAEEVDKIMPSLVVYKDSQPETVKYHDLVPMLLNELQKLRKEFEDYKKEHA